MSTTIDHKVVEMRFDNKQFEKGAQESLSTLEKLKQKLNLTSASKGLENLGASAKKVDMSGLTTGIETVSARFSAMQVIGVTALANITNSAVNAGKRMVKALTIDPVKTGFQEYETQIGATQTILANVEHKGKTLQDVTKALDELNEYADQTIYNFTEMTRNIGLFVNAGVGLDESVNSIKGFSNAAAMAGTDATRTAGAMYQLSQAMSSGKVQLMDWRSLEQANITGERFQDTIIETAKAHGIAIEEMIAKKGALRDTLKDGWLTADIMSEALSHYTLSTEKMTEEEIKANKERLRSLGYTEEQITKLFQLGTEATDAATKVKTFTQMLGTLSEAAQSGWARTWRLLVGDFYEARDLFTGISNVLTGLIDKASDWRNSILEKALASPFGNLAKKVEEVTTATSTAIDTIANLDEIAAKVIRGDFGNGQDRRNKLTEMYGQWEPIQNRVNELLGDSYRHTVKNAEAQEDLAKAQAKSLEELIKMSDAQLKELDFTDEQIKSLRLLEEQSKKTGVSMEEILANSDNLGGRALLINGLKNAVEAMGQVFQSIKFAWTDIFPPKSTDELAMNLYDALAAFHKFTEGLKLNDETMVNLARTFRGLFAVLDLIRVVTTGGLTFAFRLLNTILGAFNLNILDITAAAGDVLVLLHDFLLDNEAVTAAIQNGVIQLKELAKAFWALPEVQGAIQKFISKLAELKDVGLDAIAGLKEGLKDGITSVPRILIEIGNSILESIKNVLEEQSPSKAMYAIGAFAIAGLILGLKSMFPEAWEEMKAGGEKLIESMGLQDLNFDKIFSGGVSVGLLVILKKLVDAFGSITAPMEGAGAVMDSFANVLDKSAWQIRKIFKNTAKVVKGFARTMNAIAFEQATEGLKNIAISLAIIVGAIVGMVAVIKILDISSGELWNAVAVVTVLAMVLVGLAFAVSKLGETSLDITKDGLKVKSAVPKVLGIALSLLLLAGAVALMGSMNPDQIKQGFAGLAGMVIAMGVLMAAFGLLVKGKSAQNFDKLGKTMTKLAFAMLLMIGVCKLVGMLSSDEIENGIAFAVGFGIFIAAISFITTKFPGKNLDKLGGLMLKLSFAMLMMIAVVKLAGMLSWGELLKGAAFATGFVVFTGVLVGITKVAKDEEIKGIAGLVLATAVAMLAMIGVCKLAGTLTLEEMLKGTAFAVAFLAFVSTLVGITKISKEEEVAKMAGTILAISLAMAILAGVCILLGMIDITVLAKGVIAVAALGGIMTAMIWATKGANDVKGTMIGMAVAIGVMAAAVAALSFIDWQRLAPATAALGALMGMFAVITKSASTLNGAIGPLIVMTVAIGILSFALYKIADLPFIKTLAASIYLSTTLLSLAVIMAIVSKIPSASAIDGAIALGAFVGIMGGVLLALGALNQIPGLNNLVKDGGELLASIGYAIGAFVGSIIGGIGAGISSGLPTIGANLSAFIENAAGFIEGIKMVDLRVLAGTGIMAASFGLLFGASVLNAIGNFLTIGGSAMGVLGKNLSEFAINALPFFVTAKMIDPSAMDGVKSLSEAILIMSSANLIDGLTKLFGGESSLTKFGKELPIFGTQISEFANNLGTFDDAKAATVQCAANAIKAIADAAKDIPNEGGWLAKIVGDNSISQFGGYLPALGTNLKNFASNLGTFTDAQVSTVTCAANAIKGISDAAKDIPNEGGWAAKILGDNSLATFGSYLPTLGANLKNFASNLGTFDENTINTVSCAGEAIAAMASAANKIDGQADWAKKLFGDNSLSSFGTEIASMGSSLKGFVDGLGTFSTSQLTTVRTAVAAIKAFAELADSDLKGAKSNISGFGSELPAFGGYLADFCTSMPLTASLDAAIKNIKNVVSAIGEITSANADVAMDFAISLSHLGEDGVSKFVAAFESSASKKDIKDAAKSLMAEVIEGFKSKLEDIRDACKFAASESADSIETGYDNFYDAGVCLVKGFAKGIDENTYRAKAKASAMAKAALKAAEDELDVNSPSKEAEWIGQQVPAGFVNGLSAFGNGIKNASANMGNGALETTKSTISRIADVINSDIDAQPTIRPVLDLSNVKSGAGAISGLLGKDTSIGLLTRVGTIGSEINSRSQNGANDDVVSAIDKLRKGLGNVGNSYNINGVNYNESSDVAEAFKTIIRYAGIERRS